MKLFVAVTDYDWFATHASRTGVDEVNFWRPSPGASFRALQPGEPFLFKLHSPRNYIAGGGFFTKFLQIPVSLAWDAFGEGNGAGSIEQVRERIGKYRTRGIRTVRSCCTVCRSATVNASGSCRRRTGCGRGASSWRSDTRSSGDALDCRHSGAALDALSSTMNAQRRSGHGLLPAGEEE